MINLRQTLAMLAAGGAAGMAATANATPTTATFNYNGTDAPQNVVLAGVTEYTYGQTSNIKGLDASYFAPASDALTGKYSDTQTDPSSDVYTSNAVKTSAVLGPAYSGDSYLNLQFDANGATYQGTAKFETMSAASPLDNSNVVLESVTYDQVSAAPEPAAWALLLAGAGCAGVALRRQRRQGSVLSA